MRKSSIFTALERGKEIFLLGLLSISLIGTGFAGTITTTNTSNQSLASSNPVLDADSIPMQPGSGFAMVGTFRNLSDESLRNLTAGQRTAAHSDFLRYGVAQDFGHFGFEGLYSGTATRTTALPADALGKSVYTVIGNGNAISSSSELLIYRHSDQPVLADDPYSADADLSDQAGELILGSFGREVNISDGGALSLVGLESYQMARLVNDIESLAGSCVIERVGDDLNLTSTGGDALLPHVAGNDSGQAVLTWTTTGILGFKCFFSVFDDKGELVVDGAEVDARTPGQFGSVVAMREDGSSVITWLAIDGVGPNFHVFARRFSSSGTPEGAAIQVSTESFPEFLAYREANGVDKRSKLSIDIHDASGDFAIGWGGPNKLFLRLYNAAGVAKGAPQLLDDQPPVALGNNNLGMSPVGIDDEGNVCVAHRNRFQISVTRFSSAGAVLAGPVAITSRSLSSQDPQLSVEPDGSFLAGWFGGSLTLDSDDFLRQWFDSDLQAQTSVIKAAVDGSTPGAIRIAGGGRRPHISAFVNAGAGANDWILDIYGNGGRQLLLPDTLLLESDFDINQNTWRIAGAGKDVLMAYEEEVSNTIRVVLRRFRVATSSDLFFPINQTTMEDQRVPDIATNGGGRVVVVWTDDLSLERIMGRLLDDEGNPLSDEFVVGPFRDDNQFDPRVDMAADGKFVAVWEADNSDSDRDGILGRRFDASGQPLGEVFLVNGGSQEDDQRDPDVAIASDGSFVAVWESDVLQDRRVLFQRFDSAGKAVGPVTPAASSIPVGSDDSDPRIDMDNQGRFAITWVRGGVAPLGGGPGTVDEVHVRIFDAAGSPTIDELRVGTQGNHSNSYVALNENDGWAVVWETTLLKGDPTQAIVASRGSMTDGSLIRVQELMALESFTSVGVVYEDDGTLEVIYEGPSSVIEAVRFDDSHAQIGGVYEVALDGDAPGFVALDSGRRFAVWESNPNSAADDEIFGRVFDYSANFAQIQDGTERRVNRFTNGEQTDPRVALNDAGVGVAVWQGEAVNGDEFGVIARVITEDGNLFPTTDISVDTRIGNDTGLPDVTWIGPERFLVAWSVETEDSADVVFRFMSSTPEALNGQRVPLETGLINWQVRVAGREDGLWAGAWTHQSGVFSSDGTIHAKVFGADGSMIADLTSGSGISSPGRAASNPSVAVAGNYILFAWQQENLFDGLGDVVVARLYELVGSNLVFRRQSSLNSILGERPTVALREDGHSVIAWEGETATGDGRLRARCFDADLDPVGTMIELDPAADTANGFGDVEVAIDGEGKFIIVWSANPSEVFRENDIFLFRFDQFGFPLDDFRLQVNEADAGDQFASDIAMNNRGDALIVWESEDPVSGDPDVHLLRLTSLQTQTGFDFWAEAFGDPDVLDPEGDPDCDQLTNLMEYIMNLNPLEPDVEGAPVATFFTEEGTPGIRVRFRWRQRNDDPAIRVLFEESSDLQTWTPSDTVIGFEEIDALTDFFAETTLFVQNEQKKYYRLRFTLLEEN